MQMTTTFMVEGEAYTSLPAAVSSEDMLHILMLLIYKDTEDHYHFNIIHGKMHEG